MEDNTLGPFVRGKIRRVFLSIRRKLSRINDTLRRDLANTRLIEEQVFGAVRRYDESLNFKRNVLFIRDSLRLI